VYAIAYTQVNYVKNPSFEEFSKCPDNWNEIYLANSWRNATDSTLKFGVEYYNVCGNDSFDNVLHIPFNSSFYQFPKTGNGMVGAVFLFNKTIPPPSPSPFNYRDNLQGHLVSSLINGKTYCVRFWVNLAEASGYAQNKLGAYLDDGSINHIADTAGEEITSVMPQVYTNTLIDDTMNWVKIEGSFTANGTETYITLGNFFKNSAVTTTYPNYWNIFYTTSYYLIDDVSVIPMDLDVQAGEDTWVGLGATRKIGRIKDSATIQGLDCKWYHKGVLIDSGGIITVHANAVKGAIDTYVVVQTICGLVKTDTVLVSTVGAGMSTFDTTENTFSISPNPSNGKLVIAGTACPALAGTNIKVYDLLSRVVYEQSIILNKAQTPLELNLVKGTYILELRTEDAVQRERILID
jgi:hypothetical protein